MGIGPAHLCDKQSVLMTAGMFAGSMPRVWKYLTPTAFVSTELPSSDWGTFPSTVTIVRMSISINGTRPDRLADRTPGSDWSIPTIFAKDI